MAAGRRAAGGFTLVLALLVLALVSLSLAAAGTVWGQVQQRERERDLMRVGVLYAQALAAYRAASPGTDRQYPARLDDLLDDRRFVGTYRHLRRLYPDPLNPGQPWGLVRDAGGRIIGVFSQSADQPVAQGPVRLDDRVLPPAGHYSDWKFLAATTS